MEPLGIVEQGHASPRDTPLIFVREAGQTLPSPFIKQFHKVGVVMIGTEEARVEGWEIR